MLWSVIRLMVIGGKVVMADLFGHGTACIPCLAMSSVDALIIILGPRVRIIVITVIMVATVGALATMSPAIMV